MRQAFIKILFFTLLLHFSANASRGFYVSVSSVSTSQKDKISDFTASQTLNPIQRVASVPVASVQNQQYYFATDANDNQAGYIAFSELKNQIESGKILTTQEFNISANSSFAPTFTGASTEFMVSSDGRTITKGGTTLGTITPVSSSTQNYQVILSPQNFNSAIASLETEANTFIKEQNPFTNTQQLQNFVDLFDNKSTGFELSIGYKIRPFQSAFFIAPQLDLALLSSSVSSQGDLFGSKENVGYANADYTSFSKEQTSINTNAVSRDAVSTNFVASMVGKFGLENYFIIESLKVNYSLYGLMGVANGFRGYRDSKATNLGFKYGIGGEIFLRENIALFGEWYQIQFADVKFDVTDTQSVQYNSAMNQIINDNTGGSVTLTNGGTGTSAKTTTINYAGLNETINTNLTYQNRDAFRIASKLTAIKVGLTYYF